MINLTFSSIQQHFIRNIHVKFGVTHLLLSRGIEKKSDGVISDLQIFFQSSINEKFHNSRTSRDIGMKLGPVIKLDKKSMVKPNQIDDEVM